MVLFTLLYMSGKGFFNLVLKNERCAYHLGNKGLKAGSIRSPPELRVGGKREG